MPDVDIQGWRIYYQQQGQGPLLLMLHCGLGTGGDFAAILPELVADYTVLTPDRPGYGRSSHADVFNRSYFSLQADLMAALLDALQLGPAIFWGWSDGAIIALWTAIRYPEWVRALVLEAGHFHARKPDGRFVEQHLYPESLPEEEQVRLARQHGQDYWQTFSRRWARMWVGLHRQGIELYDGLLSQVRAPALVLNADDDPHVPLEEARMLCSNIPTARMEVFPGGGHSLHTGPARTEVLQSALDFMQGLPAAVEAAR
jgi:pimeloyl-ACP methyl ester carboxylesterase